MITSNDQENEKGHINFLECLMCRSTLAMEWNVGKHSKGQIHRISLHFGQRIGHLCTLAKP